MQQPGSPPKPGIADLRERYDGLFQTPDLLPWQLDIPGARLLLALVSESTYRDASFLDQRLNLDGKLQAMWAPLERLLADRHSAGHTASAAGFIFHVGHCGSTLLSRLLGENPALLQLREPLSLRALAETERLLDDEDAPITRLEWQALSDLLLQLLARTYREDQMAVIKPSSNCNNLLEPLLRRHPGHRAIFLYLNLKAYLANVLRPQSRGALHAFARERAYDLRRFMPQAGFTLQDLSPGRLGALNWATSMAQVLHVQDDKALATRVRVVEFETFLRDPVDTLSGLFLFLGKPVSRQTATAIVNSGHMSSYAKDPRVGYTPELRAADIELSTQAHKTDIEDAVGWLGDRLGGISALSPLMEIMSRA